MSKKTIFISHITEEKDIANIFKEEIEDKFLGMVNVFVSSDSSSIALGTNWLDNITSGLRECAAILLFCSPYSIKRPWINFECGAGWGRGIDIAPICHSGLRPIDLPLPMSLLQGIDAANNDKINEVFDLISRKINSASPKIDSKAIVKKVVEFETRYKKDQEIKINLLGIKAKATQIIEIIKKLTPGTVSPIRGVPQTIFMEIKPFLDNIQKEGYLKFSFSVQAMTFGGNAQGAIGDLSIDVFQDVIDLAMAI